MRRYLIRVLVFLLTLAFGTSFEMLWRDSAIIPTQSRVGGEFDITLPVDRVEPNPCNEYRGKTCGIVISIPNDHEIYFEREKIALRDIPTKLVTRLIPRLRNLCPGEDVVYVVPADFVKFKTLASVVDRIREVCVNRVSVLRPGKRKIT